MPRLSKVGAAALGAFGWTGGASVSASYLVVAGGGGGGANHGGGGGAGGYQTGTTSLNPTQSYTVTVGAGGAGRASGTGAGSSGSNSQLGTLTASVGGGAGGGASVAGSSGGSGGGGGNQSAGGAATSGQGSAGGAGFSGAPYDPAGGGGGAGAAGGAATSGSSPAGNGGNGLSSSISGTSVTYAGGGGGGLFTGGTVGTGGTGGGGAGSFGTAATSGTANLGGGGGGGGSNSSVAGTGGSGGSGVVIISYPAPQQFGGGVVTTSGSNVIHTFNTSGTLTPLSSLTASYLVVAGGGGGTRATGVGGSGAGGFRTGSGLTIDSNSIYLVTVGAGGAGATTDGATGASGGDSIFLATTSSGGGAGGRYGFPSVPGGNGVAGGSGGGSDSQVASTGGAGNTPSTSPSQGNNGGVGGSSPNSTAGGGGGAGAVGSNGTSTVGGAGGVGTASSITGSSVTYAGGGGGGAGAGYTGGTGGSGGGGNGGVDSGANGTSGTANTGGGAGGNRYAATAASNGGSGVVIISYAGATQLMAGGTVTITGGNVIHTFTSSGYLTPIKLVNNSLRFRSSASAYLNRTFSTGNRKTFTFSAWVKKAVVGNSTAAVLLCSTDNSTSTGWLHFNTAAIGSTDALTFQDQLSSTELVTTQLFRDPSAWYHIILAVDTTQATASNRAKLYVNGTQVTSFSTATYPTQNADTNFNRPSTFSHTIGTQVAGSRYFDGYLTEINFIDGQALTPTSFGTTNSYGVWQPITYGGSYGTNGFYLPFTNTTSATTLAYDFSPNGNNWTPNNISVTAGVTYDSMVDSPTVGATSSNYAVLNPVNLGDNNTLSNANLTGTIATTSGRPIYGSIAVTSGKWYWETLYTASTSDALYIGVNGASLGQNINAYSTSPNIIYGQGIVSRNNSTIVSSLATITVNDIVGVALDVGAGTIAFYKNNTLLTTQNLPTGDGFGWRPLWLNGTSAGNQTYAVTFGQRPFTYTAPSGFVALNTYNL